MKTVSYLFCTVLFLAVAVACGHKSRSKENVDSQDIYEADTALPKTTVKFVDLQHDFGQVKEGAKVVHVFELSNTGKADLMLQNVRASCGCTTPKYDKKPIRPNKKGQIEVVFDTGGRPGKQRKSITVVTNTEPSTTVLFLTGEVMPAEKKNQ